VLGLLAFAVGVEVFGECADVRCLFLVARGERERIEATFLAVNRIVPYSKPLTRRD